MNYYFTFNQGRLLLTPQGHVPLQATPPLHLPTSNTWHPLPALNGKTCLATEVDNDETPEGWQWMGLRETFYVLPQAHYAMAAKARELLHWDAEHRFCGTCGAHMAWHTDISKRCTACGKEIWPSPAAAIIVAITRHGGKEILLVQSHKFKRDYMGLVAGFVETGETLEACVHREVMEETGLHITNLRYFASQPWPYPFGLIIGFTAEYESGTLTLQRSELNKGGWFSAEHMPAIPGRVSLARRLIDHWLEQNQREA